MPKTKKPADNVSVATSTNSIFNSSQKQNKTPLCTQNVNVEVNIDQKDDCMVGCFKAIASIFKKGS